MNESNFRKVGLLKCNGTFDDDDDDDIDYNDAAFDTILTHR